MPTDAHALERVIAGERSQFVCSCGWRGIADMWDSAMARAAMIEQAQHHKAGLTQIASIPPPLVPRAQRGIGV